MAVFGVAYNVILPIVIVIGLGALYARQFDPNPRLLSSLIIYLFSPFLVLNGMAHSELSGGELGQMMAVAVSLAVLLAFVGWGLTRLLRFDQQLAGAFMMTVILINAGNYGLPLNEFAFGQAGLQRAMVYYVSTAVIANTLGVFLASRGTASFRDSLLNVFKVPIVYGMIIGLALNLTNTTMPLPVERVVSLLGDAAVPAMLVLLGIQLTRATVKGRVGPIALAAGLRLLLAPALAVGLVALFGMSGVDRQVAIIQSAMPTAVISGVLATEFGSDAEFTTAVILVSTVASLATLSVLLTLVA